MLKDKLKKNINKYKLLVFQILFISLFLIFLIVFLSPKDYHKNYKINDVNVREEYNKKNKTYYYKFKYNNQELDMLYDSKYKLSRKLIDSIKIINEDDNFCLIPKGDLEFIPVCFQNNKQVYYTNVSKSLKDKLNIKTNNLKIINTYQDINIYNLDYIYLIWNYDGFYYINKDIKEKIDLFNKEFYNINLINYTKDYLVIADYDSNYNFNNFYTINYKNGKVDKHSLKNDIYFDSYFPGYIKNDLYIVDSKELTMYKFNSKNGKLEKTESKLYINNNWVNKNIKTLISTKETFKYISNYNYILEDNKLYINYLNNENKTLITDNVKYIVKIDNKDIYYLKNDELYHFNIEVGEELLLNYFEWNFNYDNMIYLWHI